MIVRTKRTYWSRKANLESQFAPAEAFPTLTSAGGGRRRGEDNVWHQQGGRRRYCAHPPLHLSLRRCLGLEVLRRRFPIQSRVAANGRHHFGGRDGDGDDDDGGGVSRMRTRVSLLLRRRRRLTRMRRGFHFHSCKIHCPSPDIIFIDRLILSHPLSRFGNPLRHRRAEQLSVSVQKLPSSPSLWSKSSAVIFFFLPSFPSQKCYVRWASERSMIRNSRQTESD